MATDSSFCKIYILLIGPRDLISKSRIQNIIDLVLNEAVRTDLVDKSIAPSNVHCTGWWLTWLVQGYTLSTLND